VDLFSSLAIGFQTSLSLTNLFYCFLGALLGTLIGVLPGIGPTATIAMLLPITLTLEPSTSLIMLAGIYYGAQYGGSTTAILINLPGEATSAVTAIDGYQMARSGRAGLALAAAAISSFIAGTIATLVIALFAPLLARVALRFGPAEYFSLIVLGLVATISMGRGSLLKSLAMIVVGLLLGLVGTDIYTGAARFNFGMIELQEGVDFVALAVGVFAMSEIMRKLEHANETKAGIANVSRLVPSLADLKAMLAPSLRGTFLGSLLGILPGGGALLSSFTSYAVEKRISKHPERFGHGAIEGVAGPEAANNAGAQTSFIPMLTLGLPSNAIMALMLGAMIMQGIVPGPTVMTSNPALFWGLVTSMWIGNLILVLLNLPLVGIWVRLLSIPYKALVPCIMVFSAIGIYSQSNSPFDLYMMSAAGLLGYGISKFDCDPTPLLLGFILGPMLEEYFRRAMIISEGDFSTFATSPISLALLLVSATALLLSALPTFMKHRQKIFVDDD
jgi:TctA family transporter